jgi:hypothetical protein
METCYLNDELTRTSIEVRAGDTAVDLTAPEQRMVKVVAPPDENNRVKISWMVEGFVDLDRTRFWEREK